VANGGSTQGMINTKRPTALSTEDEDDDEDEDEDD
jgi:hypothetical protein